MLPPNIPHPTGKCPVNSLLEYFILFQRVSLKERWLNVNIKLSTTDHLSLLSKEQQPLNLGEETCDDYQTYQMCYQFTNFAVFVTEGPFLCLLLSHTSGLDLLKKKIFLFYTSLIKKQLHTNCNCIQIVTTVSAFITHLVMNMLPCRMMFSGLLWVAKVRKHMLG